MLGGGEEIFGAAKKSNAKLYKIKVNRLGEHYFSLITYLGRV